VPENLLKATIRRYDVNADGRLSKAEFEEMVKPVIKFDKRDAHVRAMEPVEKKAGLSQSKSVRVIKTVKSSKNLKTLQKQQKKLLGSEYRIDLTSLERKATCPASPGKDNPLSMRTWHDREPFNELNTKTQPKTKTHKMVKSPKYSLRSF